MGFDRMLSMIRSRLLAALAVLAAALAGAAPGQAQSFDGITIIEFADRAGHQAIAPGEHIVTFVSARGSYAAVVPRRGTHAGCQSLAVPGSYTGASISFGIAADPVVRKHQLGDRLRTYCPAFTLRFDDPGTIRIEAPGDRAAGQKDYAARQKIVAHIPLRAIDFETAPFARHDLKGVRLGPVLNAEEVGPLPARSGSRDRAKNFQRQVPTQTGERAVLRGQAAAAEVTGWPWDILYFAQYLEELERTSSAEAFAAAVLERYGEPSSLFESSGYMVWLYDLDGQKLDLGEAGSGACRATAQFWLSSDPLGRVYDLGWQPNSYDLGPWGCILMMDLNPNRASGAVTGYSARAGSGYVMAINHFLQRIEETTELMGKVQALLGNRPKF